jgi:exodeoxyribonuclease VII large subunit
LLIVGRGGGSIEDLWAFNDEQVAHAIFASRIPVISAVGHEPDVTISDYVADLRAATPSNAAELAVPDQDALRQQLDSMASAMTVALNRQLNAAKQHLHILSQSPALLSPTGYLDQKRKSLELLENRLATSHSRNVDRKRQQFIGLTSKLDAMSPLKVLTRGYTITKTQDGEILSSVRQVNIDDPIQITLSDGTISAVVTDKGEDL